MKKDDLSSHTEPESEPSANTGVPPGATLALRQSLSLKRGKGRSSRWKGFLNATAAKKTEAGA